MKIQSVLSGIIAASLLLTAGCEYLSFALPQEKPEVQIKKLTYPIKFYLESLEMDSLPSFQWEENTLARCREALVYHWPELFSKTPEQALKIRFSIGWETGKTSNVSAAQRILPIASLLSLGLIPSINDNTQEVGIGIQIKDLEIYDTQKMEYRVRGNYGLFFFLGTCFLLPEHPHSIFRAFYGFEPEFSIPDENLKKFLQIFVNKLHRFPPDKIQELYLSQKTSKSKLLE